jgi:Restriction endonuclease BpuJI - N terminal/Domain of unknown function (DUF3883)
MKYRTPAEYYFRLHHVRPRFKSDVENVLLFMANEISKIPKLPNEQFKIRLNNSIRLFPGNAILSQKTIDNWRTEISALFGFIQEDNIIKESWAGTIALKLSKEQDLVQFFKYFLFYFQYPGGHQKHHKCMELIKMGIKFKPAQYILKVLEEGEKITGKRFGIDKAELTHLIFNDLRVTRDNLDPKIIVNQILKNREAKSEYDWAGDTIRYAGDIIDYMTIANLLVPSNTSRFYVNWAGERESVTSFIQSKTYFKEYDIHYEVPMLKEIRMLEDSWFNYVNTDLGADLFKTDVLQYLGIEKNAYEELVNNSIEEMEINIKYEGFENTKEIGDLGESLILGHECMRLKISNREDLIHLVKRIPTVFAVGYDIKSVELNELQRLIEVKTTISSKTLTFYNFHLTPNEWNTADSFGDRYFVYRLMLSKFEKKLFIIQNPVGQYKKDNLKMSPRDGADIIFNEKTGNWENLLLWKK